MMTQAVMEKNLSRVTTPSDREIRIERVFNATRDRVWQAFTDPELVAQWWGRGNKLVIERMEVVRGGHWRFVEHSPEGTNGFEGRYREVTPKERVVPLDLRAAGFGTLDWRASARRAASAATKSVAASSAAEGARIVQRVGCVGCHSLDGTTAGKTGPTLKGLYGSQRPLTGKPAVRADEAYLTRSILDPAADVAQGFEPAMPSFKGVLKEAELRSVVMYLRTLGQR
jgi:uncharacterized protein YndB with AHSA1/START domain